MPSFSFPLSYQLMEFWGVEVKAGEPLKVQPDFESLIHVSQAALGESKKDKSNEPVHLFLNIDGKKMVLGTLNGQSIPQLSFDLVFEKEFELSHNWKNGSVYVCGYQTPMPDDGPADFDEESDSEDEDELIPLGVEEPKLENAKPENAKPVAAKANASKPEAAKPKAKAAEPKKDNKSVDESDDDDSEEEDDSDDSDESGEDSEEGMSVDGESDDDDDLSDSEDEETPKKAELSKKRTNDSATKTPVSTKKQKTTPQKTDGKKPAPHTATPHPAKKNGKGAANGNKSQSPKSSGQFSCTSCKKSFGSEVGLSSHNKAKHGGK